MFRKPHREHITKIIMSFNKEGKEYTNDWFDHQLRYFNSILEEFKGKDVKFLEVGSWEGRSTCWMLDNILTSKDSSITPLSVHHL